MGKRCSDSELIFHDLLGVLFIVEPVVPALHPRGRGVGDVLSAVRPAHLIPLALHQRDEFFPGGSVPHALVDGIYQPELPALALGSGAVFPTAHTSCFPLLLLRQNGKAVFQAESIGECAQTAQGVWPLTEHLPRLITDRVHNEMGVNVFRIDMSGDEHLTVRPRLLRKFPRHLVCQGSGDVLVRGEGLDIVIEPDQTVLSVHLPCSNKLLGGQLGCAVLSADQLPAVFLLRFLLLGHVTRHAAKRSCGLLLVFDECDGSHQRTSRSVSSCNFR